MTVSLTCAAPTVSSSETLRGLLSNAWSLIFLILSCPQCHLNKNPELYATHILPRPFKAPVAYKANFRLRVRLGAWGEDSEAFSACICPAVTSFLSLLPFSVLGFWNPPPVLSLYYASALMISVLRRASPSGLSTGAT